MADKAAAALDHVVVNVLRGMDGAAAIFAALGFQLTPLGRHSLGSINHLMMTPGGYLELVGVPPEGKQRQEVLDSPFGLNGLVLKSDDAKRLTPGSRPPASAPPRRSRSRGRWRSTVRSSRGAVPHRPGSRGAVSRRPGLFLRAPDAGAGLGGRNG